MTIEYANTPVEIFLYANGLSRKELAEYLGVSPQFVSSLVTGKSKLPVKIRKQIMENDRGWDVYMFNDATGGVNSRPDFASLNEQLKAKDLQIEQLLNIIKELTSK